METLLTVEKAKTNLHPLRRRSLLEDPSVKLNKNEQAAF